MRQLGKIQCLEVNNDDYQNQIEYPWIILFHGYGADAHDLFQLHEFVQPKQKYNWLFPNGFLSVPIGPAWTGRAWWNIDMREIEQAAMRGETRDFSDRIPDGLNTARENAMKMIEQLKVPWNQIVLGGFSQGAMLATELYLNAPETPKGLMLLSGTLLCKDRWAELTKNRKGQKFYQSHGKNDLVLGHNHAAALNTVLNQNGMHGSLSSFNGAHEIPPNVLRGMTDYLNQI